MGVESEQTSVQLLGHMEIVGLRNEPLEEFQPFFLKPFRMPLDTHDGLELATLDGFDSAVGSRCCGPKSFSRVINSLMVERVDVNAFALIYIK